MVEVEGFEPTVPARASDLQSDVHSYRTSLPYMAENRRIELHCTLVQSIAFKATCRPFGGILRIYNLAVEVEIESTYAFTYPSIRSWLTAISRLYHGGKHRSRPGYRKGMHRFPIEPLASRVYFPCSQIANICPQYENEIWRREGRIEPPHPIKDVHCLANRNLATRSSLHFLYTC